jgi:TonB family protein
LWVGSAYTEVVAHKIEKMKTLLLYLIVINIQPMVIGQGFSANLTPFSHQNNSEEFQKDTIAITNPSSSKDEKVIHQHPEPEGGMAEIYSFISRKLKYPKEAKKKGIEGKVYVEFVIDEQGNIPEEYIKIVGGIHPELEKEALRVISKLPKWTPGFDKDGNPIKVKMILPVFFIL